MDNKTSEIDLLDLFQKIGDAFLNGLNRLGNFLKQLLVLLIKKSIWIIGFLLIGAGIGLLLFFQTKRYFTSEMIASSNSVDNSIVINAINQLNELCINNKHFKLAEYLGINVENASKVKSIKAFYGLDINSDKIVDKADYEYKYKYNPADTSIKRSNLIFYVKVEVFDEKTFPIINNGTKNYIKKSPYILKNNEIRIEQTKKMIDYYDQEIIKLDSLQKTYFFKQLSPDSKNNQILILNEKELKLVHNDIIKLNKEKLLLEKVLIIDFEPITVLQDFTVLDKEENPWTQYVKSYGILFAIIGFVISLVWQRRRRIFEIIKQNQ